MSLGTAGERIDGTVRAKPGEMGHVVYGPYFRLASGDYRVRIRVDGGRSWGWTYRHQVVAKFEAVTEYGEKYLAQHNVKLKDCRQSVHDFNFTTTGLASRLADTPVEVRVWTKGSVPLTLLSVYVERL